MIAAPRPGSDRKGIDVGWLSKQDDNFFLATIVPSAGDGGPRIVKELGANGVVGIDFDCEVTLPHFFNPTSPHPAPPPPAPRAP